MENDKIDFLYDWLCKNGTIVPPFAQDKESMQEAIRRAFTLSTSMPIELANCLEELHGLDTLNLSIQEGDELSNLNKLRKLRILFLREGSKWYEGEQYGITLYYKHPINLTGLSALEELSVTLSNETNTLQIDGLETLTNLEILRFNVVNAPEDCLNAFKHFTKLRTFVLSTNINKLPKDTFSNLTNLYNLTLNPKFEYAPQGIEHLENLQFLHVHFQKGNICLDKLKNLRGLSLWFSDSNETRKVEILPLPYLHTLSIKIANSSNTTIHIQPNELGTLRELQMDVTPKGEKDPFLFVEGLKELRNFRVFQLRADFIGRIPAYFGSLPLTTFSIEQLDYGYDVVWEALPDIIRDMTELKTLVVRGLGMTHIQEWICELKHLEILDLQHNCLSGLPDSLKSLVNLKEVRFDLVQIVNMGYDANEQARKLEESLPTGCRLEITDDFY